MPAPFYMLEARSWSGLTEVPAQAAAFGCCPVYVTGVKPLKTGKNLLSVEFVQPLLPGGGNKRTIVGKVVQKGNNHLTMVWEDADGLIQHTASFSVPSFDWLETYCPILLQRRPPAGPAFFLDGEPIGLPSALDYLERVFGRSEGEILRGTAQDSFEVKLYKLPHQRSLFMVDLELDPLDSCFAARGCTPAAMEEKWFIYLQDQRLLFRRSWTGVLIYDLEAQWRGERLYLGQARVNRNSKQYHETDDAYDRELLVHLIYKVLCGKPAEFPMKDDLKIVPPAASALERHR